MSLDEVKEQAFKLSLNERLTLVNFIIESLQNELTHQKNQEQSLEKTDTSVFIPGSYIRGYLRNLGEKSALINQMRGLLKTDKSAPTDAEIQSILEERIVEKYWQ